MKKIGEYLLVMLLILLSIMIGIVGAVKYITTNEFPVIEVVGTPIDIKTNQVVRINYNSTTTPDTLNIQIILK